MIDLRGIEAKISKIQSSGSPREQLNMVSSLVSSVKSYVETISEENELVQSIGEMKAELAKISQDPDKKDDASELQDLIDKAESAKRNLGSKRNDLRSLSGQLESVIKEIRKIT